MWILFTYLALNIFLILNLELSLLFCLFLHWSSVYQDRGHLWAVWQGHSMSCWFLIFGVLWILICQASETVCKSREVKLNCACKVTVPWDPSYGWMPLDHENNVVSLAFHQPVLTLLLQLHHICCPPKNPGPQDYSVFFRTWLILQTDFFSLCWFEPFDGPFVLLCVCFIPSWLLSVNLAVHYVCWASN